MNRRLTFSLLFVLAAISTTLTTSCLKDPGPAPQVALLAVVNASPTSPSLDFYLDDQKVNANSIPYTYALNYFQAYVGGRKAVIKNAVNNQQLVSQTIPLALNKYYSIFITGADSLSYLVTTDSISNPGTGKALVRFLNLAPDSQILELKTDGNNTPFESLGYKGHTAYIPVTSGTYTLTLTDPADNSVKATLPNTELGSGRVYTIYAKGLLNTSVDSQKIGIHVTRHND